MHVVEYSQTKFELPNPLNSSKYVGITNDVENAWMDIAYCKLLPKAPEHLHRIYMRLPD
jgi:hypothetical protein